MYADIHTHLLPNIDGGLRTYKKLPQIFSRYVQCHISTIVVTPHLFNPYIHTDVANIRKTYDQCRQLAKSFGLTCLLGSEIFLKDTEKEITGIPILGHYYLVEFPILTVPADLIPKIDAVIKKGYGVIIAHVEQYPWLTWSSTLTQKLKAMGVLFQCDADAITRQKALSYLDKDLIDLFATDNHGSTTDPVHLLVAYARYPSVAKKSSVIFQ
jgi:protein-tyrosine phosphatase